VSRESTLLLAALLVACASPRAATAPAPPSAALAAPALPAEPAPEAPFHVVAVSVLQGAKTIDDTTLCSIPGAVFVCGTRRLFHLAGDDLVHDPALEAGLPRRADGRLSDEPYEMLGRWPDDAWLVTGQDQRSLHRWSGDRWVHVHTWPSIGSLEAVEIAPWARGRVLVYHLRLYDREAFETYGNGPVPALPALRPLAGPGVPCRRSHQPLRIEPDGSIVLRRAICSDRSVEVVARWAPGATSSTIVAPPPPPVREPEGTYRFEDVRFVRVREDGTRVPVSMPSLPDLAPSGSGSLSPSRIWEIAPGDVWVLADFSPPFDGSHARTGIALLRTRRPTRPLDLTR
jgi:hypothetical protein